MAVNALTAITTVELEYAQNPLLADNRGAVATTPGPGIFDTYQIWPSAVSFDHPARDVRIDLDRAKIFQVGADHWMEALDFLFEALERSLLQTISTARLGRYFAVEDPRPLSALLTEQVEAAGHLSSINGAGFGHIADIATIWSYRAGEHRFNVQAGPQSRDQWQFFGGPKAAQVEHTLPAVGWALSFYDVDDRKLDLNLKDSKRLISSTFAAWETLVEENVLKAKP